jgi:hypothetical protein
MVRLSVGLSGQRVSREFVSQLLKRVPRLELPPRDASVQNVFDVREQGEVVDLLVADLTAERRYADHLDTSHAPDPQERYGSPRGHQVLHTLVALACRGSWEGRRDIVEHVALLSGAKVTGTLL